MKKSIHISFAIGIVVMLLQAFGPASKGKRDGTEPGHTGSPGDSLKNCTVCHGGFTQHVDGWITSDIPTTGFVPGQRYTITATNTQAGNTRFGFQVSPQDLEGNLLGTLVITDSITTQLVGNGKYVTYRSAGVNGIDYRSWEFDWVAPNDGTNEVVFYGAFNSNMDGHKPSDRTFQSTLRVFKEGFTGLNKINTSIDLKVFPNPASDILTVTFNNKVDADIQLNLYDINGKAVTTLLNTAVKSGDFNQSFNISTIENGHYFLSISINGEMQTKPLVISH